MFRKENPSYVVARKELLGMGSFGAVYKGSLLNPTNPEQDEVAVKVISYSGDELNQLGRELYFLKNLSSPFIVKYVDSFISQGELWIVMELCDSGSLLDICQAINEGLPEAELKGIMACSILGLVHIHERRSIHRDIKAGNILLSSRGKAMLSDFGVSTQLTDSNRRKTVIGTPYWMAPEILQETSYGENADIWSLGITIIELAQGQPPHFDAKPLRAMYMIASKPAPKLTNEAKWSSDMIDFLDKCLQKDPYARASSQGLESHSWIANDIAEIKHSIAKSSNPNNASLVILKEFAAKSRKALDDMRKSRQESSDRGSTFQTFGADGGGNDISTMATEAQRERGRAQSTWNIDTMETTMGGNNSTLGGNGDTYNNNNNNNNPATWNTASFNTLNFGIPPDRTAVSHNHTQSANSPGDVSNLSTPDATMRKPVGGKISAVNTLKNQLGTLRTNLGLGNNNQQQQQNTLHVVNLENSPIRLSSSIDQGGTLRNGGLSDSGRATLRKQISGNVGNNIANNNIFIDENAATMKNELDANSRATLRQQLNADEQLQLQQQQQQQRNNNNYNNSNNNLNGNLSSNIDTSTRFRSSSTASYLVPQAAGGGGDSGYNNPNNQQYNNQIPPRPPATNNNHNTLNNNRSGAEVSTLRFQADSANVATLRRGLKLDYANEGNNNGSDTDEDQVLTPKINVRSVHAGSIDLNSNGNNNNRNGNLNHNNNYNANDNSNNDNSGVTVPTSASVSSTATTITEQFATMTVLSADGRSFSSEVGVGGNSYNNNNSSNNNNNNNNQQQQLLQLQQQPFLVVKKFDSYADDSDSLPLLPSHQIILTCQEGNLKFDQHEIQFKMAIYGSKNSKSTGCRMEVKFGNVGN